MRLYQKTENQYIEQKTQQIADRIAGRLKNEISHRVAVLKIIGSHGPVVTKEFYQNFAAGVMAEYKDYFAINLVDVNGLIAHVYPEEPNQRALGQNLLQREDVKRYLVDARDQKTPQMSHKLMTYQKVPAFTLYVPLFDKNKKFQGWLNAVVDFDTWLADFIKVNHLENTRIMVQWDHPLSGVVDQGQRLTEQTFDFPLEILNQKLRIKIGFASEKIDEVRNRHYLIVVSIGMGIVGLAVILIILLNISRLRLDSANASLTTNNSLLTSLSHDLSSPLTALNIVLDPQLQGSANNFTKWQRDMVALLIKNMKEMLRSVRIMHALGLGTLKLETQPTSIAAAIHECILVVSAIAEKKKVSFRVHPIAETIMVNANPSVLVNNVLLNVFTNAIKYSPVEGKIDVKVEQSEQWIDVRVEDEGKGVPQEQLLKIKKSLNLQSASGTEGELGSGLGLFQIRRFMAAFNGDMEISNRETRGCRIVLKFQV